MARNDGRPRASVSLALDPLPWATFEGGTGYATGRHAKKPEGVYAEILPRPGFIQDEEAYE